MCVFLYKKGGKINIFFAINFQAEQMVCGLQARSKSIKLSKCTNSNAIFRQEPSSWHYGPHQPLLLLNKTLCVVVFKAGMPPGNKQDTRNLIRNEAALQTLQLVVLPRSPAAQAALVQRRGRSLFKARWWWRGQGRVQALQSEVGEKYECPQGVHWIYVQIQNCPHFFSSSNPVVKWREDKIRTRQRQNPKKWDKFGCSFGQPKWAKNAKKVICTESHWTPCIQYDPPIPSSSFCSFAGCAMLNFLARKLEYDGGSDADRRCTMLRIVRFIYFWNKDQRSNPRTI